jgi:hypothetical protein
MMRLWTIQPAEVFADWHPRGVYRADPEKAEEGFLPAYQWLAAQMRKRLPPPETPCALPVWAWYQAISAARPRPDLRTAGHGPRGQRCVLLTIEIEAEKVLLSDFDLWHYVLGDNYLTPIFYEDEDDEPKSTRRERERSWEKIFDMDFASPRIADPRPQKFIQATFWELKATQIVAVRPFVAR